MAYKDDEPRPSGDSVPLGGWQRLMCWIGALAGLAAGVAAVFVTENEIGTGVLLAVGALFLLIAITGNAPISAKFGDNQVDFLKRREAEEVVDAAIEQVPEELKPKVAEAIAESARPGSELSAAGSAAVYEQAALHALARTPYLASLRIPMMRGRRPRGPDVTIGLHDGRTIGVEFKTSRRRLPPDVISQVESFAEDLHGVLIMSNAHLTQVARDMVEDNERLEFVRWEPGDPTDRIESALQRLGALSPPAV